MSDMERIYPEPPQPDEADGYWLAHRVSLAEAESGLYTRYQQWEEQGTVPAGNAEFLGAGTYSEAYLVGGLVRRTRLSSTTFNADLYTEQYTDPMVRGLGLAGLEQIVAVRRGRYGIRPAIYSQLVPGVGAGSVTGDLVRQIPADHVGAILDTFPEMERRGIFFYKGQEHLRISTEHGFGILDYRLGSTQSAEEMVGELAKVLQTGGMDQLAAQHGEYWHAFKRADLQGRLEALQLLSSAIAKRNRQHEWYWAPSLAEVQGRVAAVREQLAA